MKIAIGNDHAATELKNVVKAHLEEMGHEVINFGTDSSESADYPVYGEKVANAVASGECERGIAICGTGVGISIACNKVNGIRAVVCSETFSAKMSREHNDANVLCFGARVVGQGLALQIVDEWINTEYSGSPRHARRVAMFKDIEERN